MLKQLFNALDNVAPAPEASAHCDGPCGIYDPASARIAAEAVRSMTKKILALTPPDPSDAAALVHVAYDRFAAEVRTLIDSIGRTWGLQRPGGDDFERFVGFLIERHVGFWQEHLRLVQAFREGERHDASLRAKREALDQEILLGTLALVSRTYPTLDAQAVARALEPEMAVITAAFRGALEFPEWDAFVAPEARTRLVDGLAGLVLRPLSDCKGAESGSPSRADVTSAR